MDPTFLLSDEAFARRIALGLLRDRDAADDLVQEAWVEILEHPPQHAGGLRAYLALVLRRLWSGKRRADSARLAREWLVARGEVREGTSALVARAEIHKRTVAAVIALAEPYRTTVLLRFFEDLKPAQIAAREGVPVETVRTRLKRAVALLRARLEREGSDWREEWALALSGTTATRPAAEPALAARAGLVAGTAAVVALAWLGWSRVIPRDREEPAPQSARLPGAAAEADAPRVEFAAPPDATDRAAVPPELDAMPAASAPVLSGRVSDREGRPLAGAHVQVSLEGYDPRPPLACTTSDADGLVSVPLAAWYELSAYQRGLLGLSVEAWAPGHPPIARSLDLAREVERGELELVLEPGRVLFGRVLDPEGGPVGGAQAVALCRVAQQGRSRPTGTLTDVEGWFGIGLQPGERLVEMAFGNDAQGFAYLAQPALPSAAEGDVELAPVTLPNRARFHGRCRRPDGSPVRNLEMTVSLVDPAPDGTLRIAKRPRNEFALGTDQVGLRTDHAGRFESRALRPGTYQITSGGAPLVDGGAWDADGPEIEIVLDRHDLAIEVEGPDGGTLDEARVAVTRLSAGGGPAAVRTLTRGTPPLAIVPVEPGEEVAVLAAVPGCASVEERVTIPSAPYETALRLHLAPEERRATLLLRPRGGPRDAWSVDLCAPHSGVPLPGLQGLVPDADGRLAGLPVGSYCVRVTPRGASAESDAVPEYCAAFGNMPLVLSAGEMPLDFPVVAAARLHVRFGALDATVPASAPVTPLHAANRLGTDLVSWMGAAFVPAPGELEIWAPALDPARPIQRATGLRPREGLLLEVVVPAEPLRLRFALDGHLQQETELSPEPGETLEVAIPLAKTAAPR